MNSAQRLYDGLSTATVAFNVIDPQTKEQAVKVWSNGRNTNYRFRDGSMFRVDKTDTYYMWFVGTIDPQTRKVTKTKGINTQ